MPARLQRLLHRLDRTVHSPRRLLKPACALPRSFGALRSPGTPRECQDQVSLGPALPAVKPLEPVLQIPLLLVLPIQYQAWQGKPDGNPRKATHGSRARARKRALFRKWPTKTCLGQQPPGPLPAPQLLALSKMLTSHFNEGYTESTGFSGNRCSPASPLSASRRSRLRIYLFAHMGPFK